MRTLIVLAAMFLVAGCGSSDDSAPAAPSSDSSTAATSSVDVRDVARILAARVENRTGISGTIKCGNDATWPAPSKQECLLTGEEVQAVIVVLIDETGKVTWKLQ